MTGAPVVQTILVADDETYRVVEARDGEEALHLALDEVPDLAVIDVMMPKLDGCDLAHRLRANESTSRLPVILLTARA